MTPTGRRNSNTRTSCGRGDRHRIAKVPTRDGQASEEIDRHRYYTVLEKERDRLDLSVGEASLLVDALQGTVVSGPSYREEICFAVEDACRHEGVDEKWGVEVEPLLEKLAHMSPGGVMAILDAVERFWKKTGSTDQGTTALLREVGLVSA